MCFIDIPNLPELDVTWVAISNKYPKFIDALNKLKINVIPIKPCSNLSNPVNCHADMICHHLGDKNIIVANGEVYLKNQLANLGFNVEFSEKHLKSLYPDDVILNAARVGNKLLANKESLDSKIIKYCEKNNIDIINVKQGYSKCSCVVVNSNAIITEDSSIYKAAIDNNISALKISQGYVKLEGYKYGFIGGACGMISKNILAFCGNITLHPDYEKMIDFCKYRQVEIISLSNDDLMDVGGIVPLKVKPF